MLHGDTLYIPEQQSLAVLIAVSNLHYRLVQCHSVAAAVANDLAADPAVKAVNLATKELTTALVE